MKRTFAMAALIGAAASIPASKLKAATESSLQLGAEALWPATEQDKQLVGTDPTGHPDNMPPAVLADRVARRLGRGTLSTPAKLRIQNVVHYSFGALFGASYGVLAKVFPPATAGTGTAAGVALYATGHATALPLLRVQEPPWRLPRAALAWEVTSHLLFGLALELSRRSATGILAPVVLLLPESDKVLVATENSDQDPFGENSGCVRATELPSCGTRGRLEGDGMSAPVERHPVATPRGLEAAVGGEPSRRYVLPKGVAFWAAAGSAFLAFAANAAASPLYGVYQSRFGFSATTLTLLFTTYIVVLLVTLLFLGSLSDYLGRRPVILAGLVTGAVSCAMFLVAQGVGPLFAARALQGVAVGLIGGAANAALLDLRPASTATPLVSSAALSGGQALGALGASALAQYLPAPTRLVWALLLGAFIVGGLVAVAMPEPGVRRPGALSSLRPHVSVPRVARTEFVVAVPALLAVWSLAGFFLSLGPSLAALLFHSHNLLGGGVLILLFTGLGAVASVALAKREASRVMLGGCLVLIAGTLVTFASIETGTPATLLVGTSVAGLGFGPAFAGAYRTATSHAPTDDRAGMITAVYVVSYLATGIPAVIGGIATSRYGLHDTALVYSLVVAALASAAVIVLVGRTRVTGTVARYASIPALPIGPGTVPPCPPS